LDEVSFNDADYVELFYSFETNAFEVKLSAVTDPLSSSGHIIRVRTKDNIPITLTIELYQGATLIAGGFNTTPQLSLATDVFTLSSAQADLITNYADLRIRVTGGDTNNTGFADGSWIEFEVPDASIAHAFTEQNSAQTTTSGSFVDVTGASIASSNFVADGKYLIYITAQISVSAVAPDSRVQVLHGSTSFADSDSAWDTDTANLYYTYSWFTVWTAVSGEAIKMQFMCDGTNTTAIDQIFMLAVRLEADLVENTDWFFAEDAADLSLTTTFQTGATVTFTPGTANDDWLVLTMSQIDPTSATTGFETRVDRSGEAASTLPTAIQEPSGSSPTGLLVPLARVFTLGAASNTLREQSAAVTTAHTRIHSKIFALDMNKFADHSFVYTEGDTALSATNYATELLAFSHTPAISRDHWAGLYWGFDVKNIARTAEFRLQIDASDAPAGQTTDNRQFKPGMAAADELPLVLSTMANLSAAAHTLALQASADSTTGAPAGQQGSLWALSMGLAAGAPPEEGAGGSPVSTFDPVLVSRAWF
jgi:outer membrane murein-binding lipoprotein Lpp